MKKLYIIKWSNKGTVGSIEIDNAANKQDAIAQAKRILKGSGITPDCIEVA